MTQSQPSTLLKAGPKDSKFETNKTNNTKYETKYRQEYNNTIEELIIHIRDQSTGTTYRVFLSKNILLLKNILRLAYKSLRSQIRVVA